MFVKFKRTKIIKNITIAIVLLYSLSTITGCTQLYVQNETACYLEEDDEQNNDVYRYCRGRNYGIGGGNTAWESSVSKLSSAR